MILTAHNSTPWVSLSDKGRALSSMLGESDSWPSCGLLHNSTLSRNLYIPPFCTAMFKSCTMLGISWAYMQHSISPSMWSQDQKAKSFWTSAWTGIHVQTLTCPTGVILAVLLAGPFMPKQVSSLYHIPQNQCYQMKLLFPSSTRKSHLPLLFHVRTTPMIHGLHISSSIQLWNGFSLQHPSPSWNSPCNSTWPRYYTTPNSAI